MSKITDRLISLEEQHRSMEASFNDFRAEFRGLRADMNEHMSSMSERVIVAETNLNWMNKAKRWHEPMKWGSVIALVTALWEVIASLSGKK